MSRFDEQEFKSQMMRATEAMLEWAKSHPDCTLRELEERVQEWKVQMEADLEASVAVQNASVDVEEPCSWAMGIPRVSGTERDDVAGSDSGKAGIGRWIGLVLSSIRNVALSLLRYFFPDEFIPDAQRKVCVMPEGHFVAIFTTKTVKSP